MFIIKKIQEEIPAERFVVPLFSTTACCGYASVVRGLTPNGFSFKNFIYSVYRWLIASPPSRVGYTKKALITAVCSVSPDFVLASIIYPVSISRVMSVAITHTRKHTIHSHYMPHTVQVSVHPLRSVKIILSFLYQAL